jgi:hypothetical protein
MATQYKGDLILVAISEPKEQKHSKGETFQELTFIGQNTVNKWQEYKTYINSSWSGRKMKNKRHWVELIEYFTEINTPGFKKFNTELTDYVYVSGEFNLKGTDLLNADSKNWRVVLQKDVDVINGNGINRNLLDSIGDEFIRVLDSIEGVGRKTSKDQSHITQLNNLFN